LGALSAPGASYDPSACTACRGTGEVISGLGGTPHRVRCPWCEGSGRFIPEHDAQAAIAEGQPAD
jgi:DnaJ-class molecular chaperone